jgi:alkylhydroperoxidase family enzyme
MALLPFIEAESLAPELRDLVKSGLNLHKVMVHSPNTARMSQHVGGYIRFGQGLDSRLRELAILQVACAAGWEYEYAQHLKIGEEFGISSDDLAAVALETQGLPNCLDPLARLVMRAAREMTLGEAASYETMHELQATLSTEHLVDLIFAIAFYVGFGRITGSFVIEVEPQRRIYLERYPMPNPARRSSEAWSGQRYTDRN